MTAALRSVQVHRRVVADLIGRTPVLEVDLEAAAGLVLADTVVSPSSLPRFDNSAVDGYAVHAADLGSASSAMPVALPVAHHIPAGHPVPVTLSRGTAAAIMTGAPVPDGATGVVPVEQVRRAGDRVEFDRPCDDGAHVRSAGEDVAASQRLLGSGLLLSAPRIGLLAAVGVRRVRVHRRVRVAIISTGSELVGTAEPLQFGQIHESNSVMLAAAVRGCGADVVSSMSVSDSVAAFRAALDDVVADADVVITSGGVSAGDYEVVKQALDAPDIEFVSVAMSPGRPQGVGRVADTALLAFPGNPLAAYASFELFARPRLRKAMGLAAEERRVVRAPLAHSLFSVPGRRTLHLARRAADGALTVMTGQRRHGLGGAAAADCLVEVHESVDVLPESTVVEAVLL